MKTNEQPRCWRCNRYLAKKPGIPLSEATRDDFFRYVVHTPNGPVDVHKVCIAGAEAQFKNPHRFPSTPNLPDGL